jgi:hypothetical protein
MGFLIDRGVYFIGWGARLYRGNSLDKGEHKQKQELSRFISSKLSLVAIKLCIVTIKLAGEWQESSFIYLLRKVYQGKIEGNARHKYSLRNIIYNLVDEYNKPDKGDESDKLKVLFTPKSEIGSEKLSEIIDDALCVFCELLESICLHKRYPVLNRLEMLQQLSSLIARETTELEYAIGITRELLETEEQYNAPHHFTPTQVAYTCFQLAWELEKTVNDNEKRRDDVEYFYTRANEYFYKSQQMYTQRHEYYKSICDLYYLYDDFNDRYIHHNKALQMMSSTVSMMVEREIATRLKKLERENG